MSESARTAALRRDAEARLRLERQENAERRAAENKVGAFIVETQVSEYHDGDYRMAVWVNDEMLDPASARALAHILLAAADRCDGDGYPQVEPAS